MDQGVAIAAAKGDTVIPIDSSDASQIDRIAVGDFLWLGAANSTKMYERQGVDSQYWGNGHMRAQVFVVAAVDKASATVTIDKPLEFDLFSNSTADGSLPMEGKVYPSRVVPLVVVEGVGFEGFTLVYELEGLPRPEGGVVTAKPADLAHNYTNPAAEYALHGIVFKWAVNSWVRDLRVERAGSHPIVTEVAKGLRIERSVLKGSWNKGKGGNGYLRGSRMWDSVIGCNLSRELRHFTFQWSSSGNVFYGNDVDSDVNLHGGWERHNLVEANTVVVPAEHAGDAEWYPIWWGAGAKSGAWSGATGPQNVLFRNVLKKRTSSGTDAADYAPYYASDGSLDTTAFQLGWDRETDIGSQWQPLAIDDVAISDWQGNETVDFSDGANTGVNRRTVEGVSLYFDQ